MPLLAKLIDRFKNLAPPSSIPADDEKQQHLSKNQDDFELQPDESVDMKMSNLDADVDFNSTLQNYTRNRKRKAVPPSQEEQFKRRKRVGSPYTPNSAMEENDDHISKRRRASHPRNQFHSSNSIQDRVLMPPPATPKVKFDSGHMQKHQAKYQSSSDDEDDVEFETSYISPTMATRRSHELDVFDMEQARRHAAAVTLPPDSGIWTSTEQELFYHLALRGFEPLLPQNWMMDFKTLPISLFAHENTHAEPLIQSLQGTEFRAIRSLQELIEIGKNIRDRSFASPGFKTEAFIEKAINKYISWALADAGIRMDLQPQTIPVHSIVRLKNGQTTTDAITNITQKLHNLASLHRDASTIYPSIESENPSHEPQISLTNNDHDKDNHLPVLTGVMIISTVIVLLTFNAENLQTDQSSNVPPNDSLQDIPEESGLRLITTFDFSNPGLDVWNALSIAIVAVHIRKVMLESIKP